MEVLESILTPSQKDWPVKVDVFESILGPAQKNTGPVKVKQIVSIHNVPTVYLALFQGLVALLQN